MTSSITSHTRVPLVFGWLLAIGLVASCLLNGVADASTTASGSVTLDPRLPVHPYLQYGAQVQPDRTARVLVRMDNPAADASAIARAAGTTVKEVFRSIGTLVLEVPLRSVLALARVPHVRYISPDARVRLNQINTDLLLTSYPGTIGVGQVWNDPTAPATGLGVTVAVLDSGVQTHVDLPNVVSVDVNLATLGTGDQNGHGTHVVGTIAGRSPDGHYVGVAPDARVISIKVSDSNGMARASDVIRALQWVQTNATAYGIRAVNLSIGSGTAESYTTSAMDAEVEQLWLNGVTVVAAAGNRGSVSDATWYPPANDPYAITVGALDDNQTTSPLDDTLATFSSRGVTQDGFYKPDLVAPGRKIAAPLAVGSTLATTYPDRITPDGQHFVLSGTSMATPVVTGTVALLLQRFPSLTPNQIKWLLTSQTVAYPTMADKAGRLSPAQAFATARGGVLGLADQGLVPSTKIDPTTGTVVSSTSYWDTSFWDTCFWDTAYTDPTGIL